jgi:hypothetical protein
MIRNRTSSRGARSSMTVLAMSNVLTNLCTNRKVPSFKELVVAILKMEKPASEKVNKYEI